MKEIEYMDLIMCPYISADWASQNAVCLCCRHKAWRYLLITSGSRHNQGGNYCWLCGKQFIHMINEMDEYKQMVQHMFKRNEQVKISAL